METDDEQTQMRYAAALAEWADAGGYDARGRSGTSAARRRSASPYDRAQVPRRWRPCRGGEQKRLVLEACCAAPTRCCCSTSRTTSSTCPASAGWRSGCRESPKTVLYVSHDRELLNNTATRVVTVELGAAGNTVWMHPGGFATYHEARTRPVRPARGAAPALGRGARQAARRWC